MTKVRFDTVNFKYNQQDELALKSLSLEVKTGEFLAVLGHNGSGKSTMAKLINALLLPTDGFVWVDGMSTVDEDKLWEIRRTAGMVFQNPDNQIIATIVEEDVAFGPENLSVPQPEIVERVDAALKRVDMLPLRRKPPHLLSGGQKQRISIAGVLAMKPSCIVFDEPTAMLDPSGRKEVIDTLLSLKEEGITLILITHFMEEAALADRVIVMHAGEIVMNAPPNEVFQQVEALAEVRLDAPETVRLAYALRKHGIQLPKNLLEKEQLVNAICQYELDT
jgi:energy-coupling factor transport system ATP-binding protein